MAHLHLAATAAAPLAALILGGWHLSITTLLFGVACYMIYFFLLTRAGNATFLSHTRAALVELQRLKEHYDLERWEGSAFLDADTLSVVNWQNGRVVAITVSPRRGNAPQLGALQAYVDLPGASVIVLADPPTQLTGPQQFFLYHEIGHFTVENAVLSALQNHRLLRFAAVAIPCGVLAQDSLVVMAGTTALLALGWWAQSWNGVIELSADAFATTRLSRVSRRENVLQTLNILSEYFRKLAEDPNPGQIDRARLYWSRAQLARALAKKCSDGTLIDLNRFSAPLAAPLFLTLVLGLLVTGLLLVWGRPVSIGASLVAILGAIGVPYWVYLQDKELVQTRAHLKQAIEHIRPATP